MLTVDKLAVTITVTSFDITADPQVGVTVHTMIQVPAPRIVPVGVKVEAV